MFRVVLIEHGYASIDVERRIIADAGGELIDADKLPFEKALELCHDADAVLFRRIEVPAEMIRQSDLNTQTLSQAVGSLLADPGKLASMRAKALQRARPTAAADIAGHILRLVAREQSRA